MSASLILFALFVIVYIVISDIVTIFFRLTGLTEEKARFQVISLLTNSGYTTHEAETIVSSRIRRRLAQATMLFGYAFTVTIVSTTVNFFMSLSKSELESLVVVLPVLLAVMVGFHLLRRSTSFKTWFDTTIESLGNRIMFGDGKNRVVLVEDYGNLVVAHVCLHQVPAVLEDTPLSESPIMSQYNIMVMMVKTHTGEARQATADTILRQDDIIVVLGSQKSIRSLFESRAAGRA